MSVAYVWEILKEREREGVNECVCMHKDSSHMIRIFFIIGSHWVAVTRRLVRTTNDSRGEKRKTATIVRGIAYRDLPRKTIELAEIKI